MRLSLLSGLLSTLLVACESPSRPREHFVHDLEEIVAASEVIALETLLRRHELRTGNEITVVTHPTFHGKSSVDFAVAFGDSIGVGKKESSNGVVIALSKARREVFIATGYGTEKVLHDSICQRIIDQVMLPHFAVNDLYGGLWAGCQSIITFLERPENKIP